MRRGVNNVNTRQNTINTMASISISRHVYKDYDASTTTSTPKCQCFSFHICKQNNYDDDDSKNPGQISQVVQSNQGKPPHVRIYFFFCIVVNFIKTTSKSISSIHIHFKYHRKNHVIRTSKNNITKETVNYRAHLSIFHHISLFYTLKKKPQFIF